ncbi:hypothetical protein BpHYR1_042681 [Brachionus plicatilis]|uniref:SWIM-type domain-containing protein n=1 Tax=Brachionus plicatilis TaxID=10195 RepID=A0A3M7STA3_BRAPC|nr:hypothetical protein BpHYR1_042681 [Brachionus plicatilis]
MNLLNNIRNLVKKSIFNFIYVFIFLFSNYIGNIYYLIHISLSRTGLKIVIQIPTIDTHQWTLAFNWVKLDKRIVKINSMSQLLYMFTSSEVEQQASKNLCSSFLEENQWTSFDLYVKSINSIRSVSINNSNWQLSVCSCPYWNKNYVCKHTVGIANKLDLNTFPGLNLNIEANAKRGRRKQATAALVPRVSTGPINPLMITQENIEIIDSSSSNTTVNQSNQVSTSHEEESNIPPGTFRTVIIPLSNVNTNKKPRGRPPKIRNEI